MRAGRFRLLALAILAGALAVQIGLMAFLGERAYGDVLKAVNFGYLLDAGAYRATRHVVNSKTFVLPWLEYELFSAFGLTGLRAANLVAFALLGLLALALGRGRFDDGTRLLALFLLAFYPGTLRSIVAGELDDQVATLLVATGALVLLRREAVFAAAMLFGLGLLVKFWVAILMLGLGASLVLARRWARVPAALLGLVLPLGILTLADDGASLRCFLLTLHGQGHFTNWGRVALKSVTTGLAPATLVTIAAWARERREGDTLLLCLSLAYPAFVLVTGNAFVATTMMMTCLVFSGPLIATWLRQGASRLTPRARRAATAAIVLGYPAAATAITALHLHRDTYEIRLMTSVEAARTFPYNPPPGPIPAPRLPARGGGE